MSLETAIQENTAVLSELLKFWKNLPLSPLSEGSAPIAVPKALKETAATATNPQPDATDAGTSGTAKPPKPAAVSQPSETVAVSPASKPEASTSAPVTYDAVKTLILKLSGSKGRDAAAGVLAGFGVAKGPDLKPEQYAAAAKELEAALA